MTMAAAQAACLLSAPPQPPIIITSRLGEECQSLERQKERKRDRGTERKAGTTCSSWLVRTASRRQPKGMGNVYSALSGLHELYMTCYVKMLPVYCVYHALFFFPFFFFISLPPSLFHTLYLSTIAFKISKFAFLFSDKVFPGC